MFIFWHNITILVVSDFSPFIFSIFFGVSLAFAKNPKNINGFLEHFSKTILLSGGIVFILLFIKFMNDLSEPDSIGPYIASLLTTMFYVLFLSLLAYLFHTNENK